jgi:DNA primase
VSWDELATLEAANSFRIDEVVKRLEKKDPWESSKSWRQAITAGTLARVPSD